MHNLDTVDDKLKLLNSIADILAAHDNSIERELYSKSYAEQYGISLDSLQSEVLKRMKKKRTAVERVGFLPNHRSESSRTINHLTIDARYGELEYMLIVMLCAENRLFSKVSEVYGLGSYRDPGAGEVAEKLYRKLGQNNNCVLAELLNELESSASSYLVHVAETKCDLDDAEKAIVHILNKLEFLKLEEMQKQTIERIKNEQDGIKRQELGLEFSKRAERISELKRLN
jgi:DNA primase